MTSTWLRASAAVFGGCAAVVGGVAALGDLEPAPPRLPQQFTYDARSGRLTAVVPASTAPATAATPLVTRAQLQQQLREGALSSHLVLVTGGERTGKTALLLSTFVSSSSAAAAADTLAADSRDDGDHKVGDSDRPSATKTTAAVYVAVGAGKDVAPALALVRQELERVQVRMTTPWSARWWRRLQWVLNKGDERGDAARIVDVLRWPGAGDTVVPVLAIDGVDDNEAVEPLKQVLAETGGDACVVLGSRDAGLLDQLAPLPSTLLAKEMVVGDLDQDDAEMLLGQLSEEDRLKAIEVVGRHVGDLAAIAAAQQAGTAVEEAARQCSDTAATRIATLLDTDGGFDSAFDAIELIVDSTGAGTTATSRTVRIARMLQQFAGLPPGEVSLAGVAALVRPSGRARLSDVLRTAAGTASGPALAAIEQLALQDLDELMRAGIVTLAAQPCRAADDDSDGGRSDPVLQVRGAMRSAYLALRAQDRFEERLERVLVRMQVHNTDVQLKQARAQWQAEVDAVDVDTAAVLADTALPNDDRQVALLDLYAARKALDIRGIALDKLTHELQRRVDELQQQQQQQRHDDKRPSLGV